MHVLILALCTRIIKKKFPYEFIFMAKWLSDSFDRTILRKKEQDSRPSYPQFLGYLKKGTRTFNFFTNVFISKNTFNLRNELLYSHFLLRV